MDHNTWDMERIPHRCILKVYQTKDCEICATKIGCYVFNIRGDKLSNGPDKKERAKTQ